MSNPDLLPWSKTMTFFAKRAGKPNISDATPPMNVAPVHSPAAGEVTLIIHLDHYYNWMPLLESSSSSEVSGLHSYHAYRSFSWVLGVLDGQIVVYLASSHLLDACHHPHSHARCDDDLEEDG
jgi:hypothetical protein